MKLTWFRTDVIDGTIGLDENGNKIREINCHHLTINLTDEIKLDLVHSYDDKLSIYCDGQIMILPNASNSISLFIKSDRENS